MDDLYGTQFTLGRRFLARLPHGADLSGAVEKFCRKAGIRLAVFSVIGAVSSATLGAYDQKQQVYVTFTEDTPLEIAHCSGNLSPDDDAMPVANAHIVLCDAHGKTIGGRLFSETIVFAAEMDIQELTGRPPKRTYDPMTGRRLWVFPKPEIPFS